MLYLKKSFGHSKAWDVCEQLKMTSGIEEIVVIMELKYLAPVRGLSGWLEACGLNGF